MNEIEKLAATYFERFESLALYPGPRTREFWLAASGVVIFLCGLVWYLKHGSGTSGESSWAFLAIFMADGALIGSGALVEKFHKRKTLELANRGRGSNLQTVEAAKAATLCRLLNCRSFEFLRVALEVQKLRALSAPSAEERSGFDEAWFSEESKSRLMSIFLGILAVVMTLLATSATVQDEFFSAVSDTGVWQLVGVLEFVVLFLMSVLWGARRLWRAGGSLVTRWTLKISNGDWATTRKVDYLVSDLARLHRMRPRRADVHEAP